MRRKADLPQKTCAACGRPFAWRKKWAKEGATGKVLYDFATAEAQKMGWELNLDLSGHRISDFPHAAIYDGPMNTVEFFIHVEDLRRGHDGWEPRAISAARRNGAPSIRPARQTVQELILFCCRS